MGAGPGRVLTGAQRTGSIRRGSSATRLNKTKSVVLTEEGLQKAEELFKALFTRKP